MLREFKVNVRVTFDSEIFMLGENSEEVIQHIEDSEDYDENVLHLVSHKVISAEETEEEIEKKPEKLTHEQEDSICSTKED